MTKRYMKMLENGKGHAIALIFLSLAFSAWAFVVRYAADDLSRALEQQTQIMEQTRVEQVELKIKLAAIDVQIAALEKDHERHEDDHNRASNID